MKNIVNKIICLLFAVSLFSFAFAQSEEHEEEKKISAKMSLKYFRKSDGSEFVKVSVWYKEGKKNMPVENAVVNLYVGEISAEGMLSKIFTDENGEREILLPDKFYKKVEGKFEYTFIGQMISDEKYKRTETEITIKKAEIVISVSDDSTITAVMNEISDSGKTTPIADAEIKIGIKRTFSILPIGEPLATDENGTVSIECPSDIPGDSAGNIIIIAKIDDSDDYGTFESAKTVHWGIPVKPEIHKERTLWASGRNAPIPLVAVSVAIVAGIWGVLLYLVIQLFKIKKFSKKKN